jgi:Alpha/beta hydrolase
MRGSVSELLGANTDVLDRKAESLSVDARRVQDIRTLAQRALGEIEASWNGSDLRRLTQQWEQQMSPLLAGASASLDTCAARLRAQSAAQRLTSSEDGNSPGTPMPTPMPLPASPPKRGSPAENATWWKSLTARQQQQVIREHPEWIGNRDGVDFTARDLANRALLFVERTRLVADGYRIEAEVADDWSRGRITVDPGALDRVENKLDSILAIQLTLAQDDPRQLLLLDLGRGRAQAAIANGNVQTATNVAVFVPGMTTTVNKDMKGYDSQMSQLQRRSESESGRAHPTQPETTATVTWIGYQAPQLLDTLNWGKSVLQIDLARQGAAELAPFLQGIGAARDHDAHLTLLGHSYGSTTAGLALQQNTGVDDVVFFGSPGIGTDHVEDLKLAPGHSFYIETQQDVVGDAAIFGTDPSQMIGMNYHPSARESTVVDPLSGEIRHFRESAGHSEYLLSESTSQYNMSVIVAGMPSRLANDGCENLGALNQPYVSVNP